MNCNPCLTWLGCAGVETSWSGTLEVNKQAVDLIVVLFQLVSLWRSKFGATGQGYDLTWKSAVLLHARWAGISGSFWLCLHSALHQDEFRVKYGPLVGPALLSISAGLGQGGRRAVHLFNALARGIPDELRKRVIGVSVGASPMLLDALKLHQRLAGNVVLHDLVRLSSSLHAKQIIDYWTRMQC